MIELLEAALLALVQGLTEFLPISSSGHLILMREWIGLAEGDRGAAFDVVLHLGSLAAVIFWFRKELSPLTRDFLTSFRRKPAVDSPEQERARLGWGLVLATLPFVVVGALYGKEAKETLRSVSVTAWASIGFGLLLLAADILGRKERPLRSLSAATSVFIGLTQVLAMIPGASRSGTTMMGGLMVGLDRRSAARFSFLMSIPVILAVGGKTAFDLAQAGSLRGLGVGELLVGFFVSAISAYLCIGAFLRLVERLGMWPFVVYRILLGVALLIWATA